MTQWLVRLGTSNNSAITTLLDVKLTVGEQEDTFLELIKQMYVTLGNSSLRQEIAELLEKLVITKDQAKQIVKTGMLRSLLQVALEQGVGDDVLLQNFEIVGRQIALLVCFGAAASEMVSKKLVENEKVELVDEKRRSTCELVVKLMLSGVSLVFADGVRMLQLLIDNASCRTLLVAVPDLRGALEKAHTLARLNDSKLSHDEYLKELCDAQFGLLGPEIDAYERQHGSVVGLPPNDEPIQGTKSGETALELAARIGASVQVCSRQGDNWHDAMVSDVEDNGPSSKVEILYDDADQEDEWVSLSRIRLRMNTTLLTAFDDLAVDCSMNMGKAFTALGDHDQAVQCFTHVLTIRGGKLIAALYSRGVANMARRDLTAAKQDLWNANQQCREQQTNCISGGASKTNTRDAEQTRILHKQIVIAYKKLQRMHANKKRLDKKVIKQMVKYLSTIPELQDQ
ncbi:hypothetical protein PHMEG_00097 [Phytophthora megakarya]|uniref:Tetratricopeptide repeat protein n=1 Tax=Phytophthora megakarya TaxID=4795 RepID=A0A225X4J6_9STRA|nr:hypothetical protein PHMEG_00097 [Phytophthora megakarya]